MVHVGVRVQEEYLTLPVGRPDLARIDASRQVQVLLGAVRVLQQTGQVRLTQGLDTALGPLGLALGTPGRGHDEALLVAPGGVVVVHPEVVSDLVRHHEDAGEPGTGVGLAATVGDAQLLRERSGEGVLASGEYSLL